MRNYHSYKQPSVITWAAVAVLLLCAGQAFASYKFNVGGAIVSSSSPTLDAHYDPNDGTLTVIVSGDATLSISLDKTASSNWGNYVDIYILAGGANLKSLSIKGANDCFPFVCGDVGYAKSLTLSKGVVGDTDSYGLDFGLGMAAGNGVPSAISIKIGHATAQVLGYPNVAAATAQSATAATSAATVKSSVKKSSDSARAEKQALIEKIRSASTPTESK